MILLVAGTRPEVIKLAPVAAALRKRKRLQEKHPVRWLWTSQQKDIGLDAFDAFGDRPDDVMRMTRESGTLNELFWMLGEQAAHRLDYMNPSDMVVVQGDTLTTAVYAQQAFLAGIPVAHVEAGLRSGDIGSPYPEEASRIWTDAVAALKFVPTHNAMLNLGLTTGAYVTGQTGIDAVRMVKRVRPARRKYAVVTMHRRENMDSVVDVCRAVRQVLREKVFDEVVWPVHPNPAIRSVLYKELRRMPGCTLVSPLRYDRMINLVRGAKMLITDSGGLQEEALALHVPCLVTRRETERPEGVSAGGSMLVGPETDKIVSAAKYVMWHDETYRSMQQAENPYGDGKAGPRIARIIEATLLGRSVRREQVEWSGPGLTD